MLALFVAVVTPALADDGAAARQAQAIQRLERLIDQVRRDGPTVATPATLAELDQSFEQNNARLTTPGEQRLLIQGLIKRGSIARLQGHAEASLAFYEQARQQARRAGDAALQADAMGWAALTHFNQRQVQQALALTTEALPMAERAGDLGVLARVLEMHVTVLIKTGDLNGAALSAEREVATARQAADPKAVHLALTNRASVALKQAELCDHRPIWDDCLKAVDAARQDMLAARDIVARLGDRYFQTIADEQISLVEVRRAIVVGRRASEQRVLALGRFNPRKPGDVLVSEVFRTNGPGMFSQQLRAAFDESRRKRAEVARFRPDDLDAGWLYLQGQMADAEGRNDEALAFYLKALDALERDRRSLRDERAREGFVGDSMSAYDIAMLSLLQRRRQAEAYELMERSRSRVLTELLAGRTPELRGARDRGLLAEAASLRARIAEAQSRWVAADNRERADALAEHIHDDETRHRELMARIDRESPRLARLVSEQPATLAALQAAMRSDGFEVLQYQVTDAALIVWHISAEAVTVRNVFLPRAELSVKLATLRTGMAAPGGPFNGQIAEELYLFLVQPFVALMKSPHLVILPHGELGSLPFAVLRDPQTGRFLGEDRQLSYAPSASVLLRLKPGGALGNARVTAFADPSLDAEGRELQTLRKLFGARARVGADELPPKSRLIDALAGQDVVHLAVHGYFDALEPMRSFLQVGDGSVDAGRLTAAEMFGLPLESARLVVLSACESGRADNRRANETQGMARGLLYAGAQSLLLSQWKVDSEATASWMQAFYESAKSRPLPEAAQAAALRVKAEPGHEHPFYWAAFTLISR